MALEDQHYAVSLLNSQRLEIIGTHIGYPLHVAEGEPAFLECFIDMKHSQLIRVAVGDSIYNIKGKIEFVFIGKVDRRQKSVVVFCGMYKLAADQLFFLGRGSRIPRKHHCHKKTFPAVHGYHSVRCRAVIVNAVPLAKIFNMVAYLHLQPTAHDEVKFLTGVSRKMDGLILQLLVKIILHPVWLCNFFAEKRGEVFDFNAILLSGLLPLSFAGYGKRR